MIPLLRRHNLDFTDLRDFVLIALFIGTLALGYGILSGRI